MNRLLRFLLAIWVIGYVVVSCVPLVTGNAIAGGLGFAVGAILIVPWLLGVLILAILIWLTNPQP